MKINAQGWSWNKNKSIKKMIPKQNKQQLKK